MTLVLYLSVTELSLKIKISYFYCFIALDISFHPIKRNIFRSRIFPILLGKTNMSFANLDTRIEFDECVRLALCKPQQMLRAPVHTQLAKRTAGK